MDKIRVYKTYNAADMAAIEPLLKGILRSFPDFAIGSTSIEVNNDGTWYAMADMSLVKGLPPSIKIKNEQDAFAIAQKWMQKFDEKLSGRVHDAQLPSRLFDGDLLPISATPTLKEINGLKIPSEWLCNYKLQVKPSTREKAVIVDNAEIRIVIGASGIVLSVRCDFLPVKESESFSRQLPAIVTFPVEGEKPPILSVGYELQIDNNVIVPYYYIIEKQEKENSLV